jgi:cytochrome c peroxidase
VKKQIVSLLFCTAIVIIGCKKDKPLGSLQQTNPYVFDIALGTLPSTLPIPATNTTTKEGVALGRMLFYDPILSGNNTQSCASCHKQEFAFTDGQQFSRGIDGSIGHRNAMPIFNLMWNPNLFWDGRDKTLEEQALDPIIDPLEMKANLNDVLAKLNSHPKYPDLFFSAFQNKTVTKENLAKALSQFERTIISNKSKYDKVEANPFDTDTFTASELRGKILFEGDLASKDGDCIHCHTSGSTFTNFEFKNNGLDLVPTDSGRYKVTKNASDIGKFKTPTLRNIEITAPYMHDGRFTTLEEVMDHYNINFHEGPFLDGNMKVQTKGRLSKTQRNDIIAFMKTLTDKDLITNPAYSKP